MPSLKEIKNRIASVKNTRKITSAMKMVASSKLHHAQSMIESMLPYEMALDRMLRTYLASDTDICTVYQQSRPMLGRVALVVFSSNSSLCGGFNNNVIKLFLQVYREYSEMVGSENVLVYPIGRKIFDQVKKFGIDPQGEFSALADKPNAGECRLLAEALTADFLGGKIDRVELIYHHFRSAASHVLTREQLLPVDVSRDVPDYNTDFIVEPDMATVLGLLIPKVLNLKVYTALLDSNACEHAARMIAMQTATDNADELLRQLNLQYNKSRQNAITSELLDIVAGSQN